MLVLSKLGTFLPWIISGVISAVFPTYAMIIGLICSLFSRFQTEARFSSRMGIVFLFFHWNH